MFMIDTQITHPCFCFVCCVCDDRVTRVVIQEQITLKMFFIVYKVMSYLRVMGDLWLVLNKFCF